ncbi:4-hydroxy-tetrahydrodipicolinate synthase [Trinickia symbiotica]|uniref:4-hydroxy-tetrahydrodipicolinate synthase n=1 Tax=Trinickia symbiotica TaxID=863227 RepID=A0A2T3Y0W1_9BURK|nr:4-hydroxy-tetrahydrodipicolinate synthase [Trinickia symbiotica]PTB22399.1 4-hydroxy-tetrahydrodipicolinate synthase [Trinickia symbiotica]
MSIFSGIWIPLVTPFSRGAVDHVALAALVDRYRKAGVAGFAALGTTGEPAALSLDEQDAVLETILQEAEGVPVIAGLAGNQTAQLQNRVRRMNERPISGLLISAPYYVRPSQAGLVEHFERLADLSTKPIVLYDIPYRTGVRLELDTLLTLAAHPRIVAIKDCSGSVDTTLALIRDGRLQVLAGNDDAIFNTLCMGGNGAIAASAHLRTEHFVAMHRALAEGRLADGRAIFHELAPLVRALMSEPNPAPVKAALAALGLIDNELRAPMTPASEALTDQLARLLSAKASATASMTLAQSPSAG